MNMKEFYESIGGSYETAIGRLMNEALMKRFVGKFPKDPSFSQLKTAMEADDWAAAFSAAHTLKGVALNLAFQKLGENASALTETLRPQHAADFSADVARAQFMDTEAAYEAVMAGIAAIE